MRDDGRLALAKSIPILEVAARLGVAGLRRMGREHVGACPVCGDGGKRFPDRFQINPDRGLFICRQCPAAGDGLALVQHVHQCDFRAALAFLAGEGAAVDPEALARARLAAERKAAERERYAAQARARAIRDAREIWRAAGPALDTPAEQYLAARGIGFPAGWPPSLRFIHDHRATRGAGGVLRGPCLIAAIQGADGRLRAVHQTWIDPDRPGQKASFTGADGAPLPAKLVRGSKKGGTIRLTAPSPEGLLVMGEGIETTASVLASGHYPGAAFWCGVDLGNMAGRMLKEPGRRYSGRPDLEDAEAFVPPAWVRRLVFLQDGDSDPAATVAKLECGLRRAKALGAVIRAEIVAAPAGQDFNDVRRAQVAPAGKGPQDER